MTDKVAGPDGSALSEGLGLVPERGDGVMWAPADGAQMLLERAASMLTGYGELIRRDGASRVEEHHYLPEVEHVAAELRALMNAAAAHTSPTMAPGQCPMCGEYSMSARARQGLYGHAEHQDGA